MSAFSKTLRLRPLGISMSSFNGYGYINGEGPDSVNHNNRHPTESEDDDSDEGYPRSRLGNLDDDGFPTMDQMLSTVVPTLAENKITGQYKHSDEYLRTHFELMQEDFMYQVRKALQEFMLKFDGNNYLTAARVYKNVSLKNVAERAFGGETFVTCGMDYGSDNNRYEQPDFGNFLVFTKRDMAFDLFVGMVVAAASQTGEDYSVIRLQFEEDYNIAELENCIFNVIEPDNPFFLSYFCVYNALSGLYLSNKFSKFRMAPYILKGSQNMEVKPPEYLNKSTQYRIFGRDVSVLNQADWPRDYPKYLNKSQYEALRRALAEEIALIQGPPGTGKTYFGVELVKVLLDNIHVWNPSRRTPLLVVCHSNHALDHFLEGIHEFTRQFVRVGARCEREVIKPYCLVEKVCRDLAPEEVDDDCTCKVVATKYRKPEFQIEDDEANYEDAGENETDEEECLSEHCKIPSSKCYCLPALKRCMDLIDKTRGQIRHLTEGIVNFKVLQFWGVIDENTAQWFEIRKNQNGFLKWLGLSNIRLENRNKNWQDTTDLLVNLHEFSKRIDKANAQKRDDLRKKMKADWNRIQSIIAKFKKSSREDISEDTLDIFSLSPIDAQKVYVKWLDSLSIRLHKILSELEKKLYYNFWDKLPRKPRYESMLKHLRSAHVIGLTSTGAAARRSKVKTDEKTGTEKEREGILEKIASPIVILEEAAQILESHVIVSMTTHCKHLIMLGDHQQLKPCVTTQHLATEYNLNVSLFERLLRAQVVKQTCLTYQNRMRPEIASLLRPHIYKKLFDAPPTRNRPNVRGLPSNVFFLDHRERERKSSDQKGFWNPHEIDMLLKLSKFLVSMGYLPSQITIISMYNEQRRKLLEDRDKIPSLVNMEITSVDGFQGKENEIILLSLVRNNDNGNIGFLDEVNRICVALSRARSGLYIMGNMKCLTKYSAMWREVFQCLQNMNAIGSRLNLVCARHAVSQPLSDKKGWTWTCEVCSKERKKRQKRRVRRSNKKLTLR